MFFFSMEHVAIIEVIQFPPRLKQQQNMITCTKQTLGVKIIY